MGAITNFLLFSFVVAVVENVTLEKDKAFLRVRQFHEAELKCCFSSDVTVKPKWMKQTSNKSEGHLVVNDSDLVKVEFQRFCGILTFKEVHLKDTGLYQCFLNHTTKALLISHGTYLQVYKLMEKTINLSESTKNKILIAEGVILLLCVMVPSLTLLFKSKRLEELEKKKAKKEEENIYQGLNLDECWSTYDQIERSQAHGQYQDVGNGKEEEEPIQLEKP